MWRRLQAAEPLSTGPAAWKGGGRLNACPTKPTLVKHLPPPLRKFVGDLSDLEGKLFGVDVRPGEREKS